jgi:hypothetical protein
MSGVEPEVLKPTFDLLVKWTPRTTKVQEAGLRHSQELMLAGQMIKDDEKLSTFAEIYTNKFTK